MAIRAGYKKTEKGVIPNDWQVQALFQICKMKSGESITSANIDLTSPFPCYGGNGLRGYTDRFTHDGRYALVGRQGALCGNVVGVSGKFFASEHAVVVTPFEKTAIQWLTYILEDMELNQYSESSAQPGLSVAKILDLNVVVPPTLAEQKAIAAALSDADALIAALEGLIAKKRQIKQGAMQELLTGKRRLPGFSGEWEEKKIEDIAIPSSEMNNSGDDLPVLTCSKHLGFVDSLSYFKNQVFSNDTSKYMIIKKGQIGYPANHVEEGSIGLQDLYDTAIVSPIYVVFSVGEEINSFFLHRLLKLDAYRQKFSTETNASVNRRGSLRWPAFSQIKVRFPNIKEQTAIAEILSDMDAEIAALAAKLSKARQIKVGMMQELLTGRVRLI